MAVPNLDQEAQAVIATATTVGLGLAGGGLTVVFSGSNLTKLQKVACVFTGGVFAYVVTPVITVFWAEAPKQLFGISAFFSGLVGMYLVKGIILWAKRAEGKVPNYIDKRIGVDTSSEDKK